MSFVKWLPANGTMRQMFKRWPELAHPLAEFTEVLMRGPSPLSIGQRELVAAVTSAANTCQFCYGTHKATAEAFGIEGALIEQIVNDINCAGVEEAMKPLLAYARKLTMTPARMTQADADAIFAAGWDEVAFHHVVSICALFNYYNRILEGYGIKMDQAYYDEAGQHLARVGYIEAVKNSIET